MMEKRKPYPAKKVVHVCCAFAIITLLCFLSFASEKAAYAVTGCSAAISIPYGADLQKSVENIECPTKPCKPGKCTYTANSGSGIGTFTNCGPITTCVLEGEDPPITDKEWDEEPQGFQGKGAAVVGGKCAPPKLSDLYELSCPAFGTSNMR